MSKQKGRVRIETNHEPPQTFDVGKNEEITVRTKHEKPEVTGGGGGGGINLGFGDPLSILIAIIIFLFYLIRGCNYVVETYIIKSVNPDYVTSFEKANQEKKVRETSEKERQQRIEILNNKEVDVRNFLEKEFCAEHSAFIEIVLVNEYEIFATINPVAFWSDGHLLIRTLDGGNTWQTLMNSKDHPGHLSVSSKNGQRIIKVRLIPEDYYKNGIFWAISKDDGETWQYLKEQQLGRCPQY